MKKVKGYISSRKVFGNFYPQKIQNLVIRDYCKRKKYFFLFSSVEYSINKSYLIFEELLENIDKVKGIVCFSIFQFPLDNKIRNNMFNKIIKKRKFIDFALEEISIKKKVDILNVNELATIRYEDEIKKK